MKTVLPEIPPETLAEWQRAVDLTARLARVPASLIMRTERPKHTVLVSSRTEGNPYDVGREYDLNALLYCQGVFDNDGELVVEDATHDPVWAGNEDLADGMRFYIGYPLKWPSGEVFGTIWHPAPVGALGRRCCWRTEGSEHGQETTPDSA